MKKVKVIETGLTKGCWEWQGAITNAGYGKFAISGKRTNPIGMTAHRFSFTAFKNDLPIGSFVCHSCDNRLCVNPYHLFSGSRKDNTEDMLEKGRQARGSRNSQSKLNETQVEQILRRLDNGEKAHLIAPDYGVHVATIQRIRQGKIWSHCKGKRKRSHGLTMFEDYQIVEILKHRANGITAKQVAKEYGCSSTTIQDIYSGKTYKHIIRNNLIL